MTDPAAVAGYRRAIARAGERVTFQRLFGNAPNVRTFSATVKARVAGYMPNSGVPAREGFTGEMSVITQGDRNIIVMVEDLAAKRFPLPLRKNDRVILLTGEELNVTVVDARTRALGGALDVVATGL
jgi:hypothetical protein